VVRVRRGYPRAPRVSHPSDSRPSSGASSRAWLATAAFLVAFGLALRIVAARGEPWLDEMWSWGLAQKAATAAGVFALAHDNNHPLNTLWMLAVGDTSTWIAYRVPALLAGGLTLVLAAAIPWRRSRVEAVLALVLAATSFLLVTYQSEARGYAGALLAAFTGWWAIGRWFEDRRPRWVALYAASSIVGVLSHLTWAHAFGGLLAWSAWRIAREPAPWIERARRCALLHALPFAALTLYWILYARAMVIGGGPERPLADVLASTVCFALGAPDERGVALAIAVVIAALLVLDVVHETRTGHANWVLTLGAVVVAPALSIAVFQPDFVAPRYFLVAIAFLYAALARRAAAAFERGGAQRWIAASLVAAVVFGNLARVVPFLREGRGHAFEMLAYAQSRTRADVVTLGGVRDYDLRLMVAFFEPHLAPKPRIALVTPDAREAPEWLVEPSVEVHPSPRMRVRERGVEYALERTFLYFGQSGMHCFLYRRVE